MPLLSCRCATNDGRHRMAAMQLMRYRTWKVCCRNRRSGCTVSRKGALCCCLQLSCCSWPWSHEPHGPGDSSRGGTVTPCTGVPAFLFPSRTSLRNKSEDIQCSDNSAHGVGGERVGEQGPCCSNTLSQTEKSITDDELVSLGALFFLSILMHFLMFFPPKKEGKSL